MFIKLIIFLVFLSLSTSSINGKSVADEFDDDSNVILPTCQRLGCSKGAWCKKYSEILKYDRKHLFVQVLCFDSEGTLLAIQSMTEINPYADNVYFKGLEINREFDHQPSRSKHKFQMM